MRPHGIKFSIQPCEVLTAGTPITITAPRAVDPLSAQDAVSIRQWGSKFSIVVSVTDEVIRISTDKFLPGAYEIQVRELLDTDNGRIVDKDEEKFLVIPFTVRAANGKIPKEYRVEHAVLADVAREAVLQAHHSWEIPAGARRVEFIKAVHRETENPIHITLAEGGAQIDRLEIFQTISNRRKAMYGTIHETLWIDLKSTPLRSHKKIDIVVWPAIKEERLGFLQEKFEDRGNYEYPAIKESMEYIQNLRTKIMEKLRELNAIFRPRTSDELTQPSDITIRATIHHSLVKYLASLPEVGIIFLDDRKATEDLADSMIISRSNRVLSNLDHQGQNINVAVFENGPDDIANLAFTEQYSWNLKGNKHARLTSAIIKNTQQGAPQGYAPQCNLFSANSTDNEAFIWASKRCTVINQSFHRPGETGCGYLQADDLLKDWIALNYPYPLIVQAAGNIWDGSIGDALQPESKYVSHKGHNTLTVGSHDDDAEEIAKSSVYRNPTSTHGDRELPELCANGIGVSAVGLTMSGTSFAAAAVSGVAALIQGANNDLKHLPEANRAILLTSSNSKITGSSWWSIVSGQKRDSGTGTGSLDAEAAIQIALNQILDMSVATSWGWSGTQARKDDFDPVTRLSASPYKVKVPSDWPDYDRVMIKVALAWNSTISMRDGQLASVLDVDLDLIIKDEDGDTVAISASFDNSYEVAEFIAEKHVEYSIFIRYTSGNTSTWAGLAWTARNLDRNADQIDVSGIVEKADGSVVEAESGEAIETLDTETLMGLDSEAVATPDTATVVSLDHETMPTPDDENFAFWQHITGNHWKGMKPGCKNSAKFSIENPNSHPYDIALGLNMVDIGNSAENRSAIRVRSYITDKTDTQFCLKIDSWDDTMFYNAAVSWLKIPRSLSYLQYGDFWIEPPRHWGEPGNVPYRINFGREFSEPPIVFVGLNGFDITKNWRIYIEPTEITTTNFILNIGTWGDSKLHGAKASWIAYSSDRRDIKSGIIRSTRGQMCRGRQLFGEKFEKAPVIFTALTEFNVNNTKIMRVKVWTNPSVDGFDWEISSWCDTEFYDVRFAWLALVI
ncbi:hypothetical protein ABW19_dt0201681 [Dactylella cylindrospora]|nr:hypothetical protein ABW19_dt0201681 [Dactylella cylindrospora]